MYMYKVSNISSTEKKQKQKTNEKISFARSVHHSFSVPKCNSFLEIRFITNKSFFFYFWSATGHG